MDSYVQKLLLATRLLIGLVFLSAGIGKSFMLFDFSEQIGDFLSLRAPFSHFITGCFVLLEIVVGAFLIFGIYLCVVVPASFSLVSIFSIYLFVTLTGRGIDACNCFGSFFNGKISYWDLLRNGLLLLGLFAIAKAGKNNFQEKASRYFENMS